MSGVQEYHDAIVQGAKITAKPDPVPLLDATQEARAEALRVARSIMVKNGFLSNQVDNAIPELVDMAEYILSGTHPMDRYDAQDDTGASETSESPGPVG